MSADSTELTFVRCPSCRSLVPAVSTRCRMCGATIDAQGKETPPEESAAPRRARQHTITQPSTEFIKAVDSVKKTPVTEAPSDAEEFDPLRDFMDAAEEQPVARPTATDVVPTAAPVVPESASTQSAITTEADDDDFDIFADDEDDDWLDDLIDDPKSAPEKMETKEDLFDDPFPQTEEVAVKPAEAIKPVNGTAQASNRGDTGSHPPAAPVTREVPKVVVESGNRPAGKSSPFSFSKGKGESTQNPRDTRPQVSVVPKAGNPAVQGNRPKDQRPPDRGAQRPDNRSSQQSGKSYVGICY